MLPLWVCRESSTRSEEVVGSKGALRAKRAQTSAFPSALPSRFSLVSAAGCRALCEQVALI